MTRGRVNEDTEKYKMEAFKRLKRMFGEREVEQEWDVAKGSEDAFNRKLYCPRLDLAVGPFNVDGHVEENNEMINQSVSRHRALLKDLFLRSETDLGNFDDFLADRNKNPRCFLAIELENSGSRKHMLGDVVNASILGAIGIVVPLNEKRLRAFRKIREYIVFATKVGKLKASFNNVILLNRENFMNVISSQSRTLEKNLNIPTHS